MPKRPNPKPKISDAERQARFKAMAREVEAEGEAPDFDETVKRLAAQSTKAEKLKPT